MLLLRNALRQSNRRLFVRHGSSETQAHLFGIKPGTYKKEGWEDIVYPIYGASAILLTFGLAFRPDRDLKSWSFEEAKARNKAIEAGKTVEWGKHYGGSNAYTFRKEGVGEVPAHSEEDDDGDE